MAMKPFADICFSDGEYEDRKTGEKKKRYVKFAVLFKDETNQLTEEQLRGLSIRIPLFDKWFALFKRENRQQKGPSLTEQFRQRTSGQQDSFTQGAQGFNEPPAPTDNDLPFG